MLPNNTRHVQLPKKHKVQDFVSRYMPAYRAYLPTLYAEGPNGADPKHTLVVEVDEERNPIA
ncbi:hypothetical protein AMTRI_Chr05g72860 [Amborella trichopoda]